MLTLLCAVFNSVGAVDVTDVLTRDLTGVTGNSYTEWSGIKVTSNAVYAGQSAGSNESIQLRSKNNNSGIVTTASGGTVKSISVTWNSNTQDGRKLNIYGSNTAYTSPSQLYGDECGELLGTIEKGTDKPTTLEIEGEYAYIGLRSAADAMYLDKVTIVWDAESAPTPTPPAAPTFSPEAGTFYSAQSVSISCTTDGATIYYTLDGSDPTASKDVYSEPIEITETTTIKAMAVKGELTSGIVSATYTIEQAEVLPNIAALAAQTPSEATDYNVKLENAVVTYVNGNNAYIQDASGAILMYKREHGLSAGQTLTGTATVTYQLYNGTPEITALDGITPADGTAPEPTTVEASAWNTPIATVLSQYFKVTGATITKSGSKYNVKLGEEDVQLYGQGDAKDFSITDLSVTYTIIGFPTLNNTTLRLQIFEVPTPESTTKEEAGLSFSEDNFTATIGQQNTFPTLNNPNGLDVTYRSTHEDVATVDENGVVTLVAAGKTTIIASTEGNDKYLAGNDSYELIVKEVASAGDVAFELIKDATTLAAEDQIIIVNADADHALGVTQNANNRSAEEVTPEDNGIIIPSNQVQVITLKSEGEKWAFYTGEKGYLYAASSSSNNLKSQTTIDDNARASISIDEDGVATITFQGENTRNVLRYNPNTNNNAPLFSCYGSASETGTLVRIYRSTETPKTAAGLAYSAETFTATIGEENAFPVLSNENGLDVTYASSDEKVATISAEGVITLVAAGTTTISANSEENEEYKAGHAFYVLTVVQPEEELKDNSDVFELVTDFTTLAAGDEIIFVGENSVTDAEENTITSYYGLSINQKPNNREAVTVTHNANGTITGNNKLQTITLEGDKDGWYFNVGNGYLYAASNDKNYLRTETEADDNAKAAITTTEEGLTSIVFQGTNSRNTLQFNAGNAANLLFSCYAKASQKEVKIYRKILIGDANGDGYVTVADVMLTVDYVFSSNVEGFHFENADINSDGKIGVTDVMGIVDIVVK